MGLLLLGAGDVAKYVAEMALALEYDVTFVTLVLNIWKTGM
ncbi:MAG: hypothetical protein Ct9H300mP22_3690 [Gammaproteobacteria bacterium]|nr:MAG: hypothetical protein Ct9H300mP22_3690 [Gammaproteobacteria bacterium]